MTTHTLPELAWALMACNRSEVRPSCRKNNRWPTPHSGAVRNSSGPAAPWFTPSAKFDPMWWTAKSERGLYVTSDMPVNCDLAVLSVSLWHKTQPVLLNNFWPFNSEGVLVVGVGGAVRRMNMAKLVTSEFALPVSEVLGGVGVVSSGVALNTQFGTAARSLGKPSFETPCSTL